MNEFGIFLASLRKREGMTQQELADKLGVTNKAISKWETGEALPDTALLIPISDIFGVSVDELLRGKENERTEQPHSPQYEHDRIVQKYAPAGWEKRFALLICFGVGLILMGVMIVITFGLMTDDTLNLLVATSIMLVFIAIGVDLFIIAGIFNENAFLPISDPLWRKKVKCFTAFITSGFTAIMIAVVCFILTKIFENESVFFNIFMALGFVILFGGVTLLVYGGVSWDGYSKRIKASLKNNRSSEAEDALAALTTDERKRSTVSGKICGIIMISATAIYLVIGFIWLLWHPGWIIFPVAGLICGIINIIFDKKQ